MRHKYSKLTRFKPASRQGRTAPAKPTNWLIPITGGVIILLFLIWMGLSLSQKSSPSSSRGKKERQSNEASLLLTMAQDEETAGNYRTALDKYRQYLRRNKTPSRTRKKVTEAIKRVQNLIEQEDEAETELATLIKKGERYGVDRYPELAQEYQRLIKRYGNTRAGRQARKELRRVKEIITRNKSIEVDAEFNRAKADADQFVKDKDYARALEIWNKFLQDNSSLSDILRNRVRIEIDNLNKLIENSSR